MDGQVFVAIVEEEEGSPTQHSRCNQLIDCQRMLPATDIQSVHLERVEKSNRRVFFVFSFFCALSRLLLMVTFNQPAIQQTASEGCAAVKGPRLLHTARTTFFLLPLPPLLQDINSSARTNLLLLLFLQCLNR